VGQTPGCAGGIAAVRLQVETFVESLVVDFAPDVLAAKDARLQADLKATDTALAQVDSDVADIAGSQS
jgi:hypothetical protein